MIYLEKISKFYGHGAHTKCILNEVTCFLDTSVSIGVLGLNGSGKSTLLSILSGTMKPSSGRVYRRGTISWPMGLNGFSGSLTGEENLRFVARIYGAECRAVRRFVAEFAELGDDLFRPVKTYSAGMRARLSLALSLAIHFDVYLVDEGLSVGDSRFGERYREAIKNRFQKSRVIIVSHNMMTIRQYCSHAMVLNNGRVSDVLPLDLAAAVYEQIATKATR